MTILYVLFAVLMGSTCLLMFALTAALLVESLYRLWPMLAQFDVDLAAPLHLPEWARRKDWQCGGGASPSLPHRQPTSKSRVPGRLSKWICGLDAKQEKRPHP